MKSVKGIRKNISKSSPIGVRIPGNIKKDLTTIVKDKGRNLYNCLFSRFK